MKNLNTISLLAFVAVIISLSSFRATTVVVEEQTRNLPAFKGIGLGYPANVILRQGSTQSVRLEGDAEQLAKIETEVKDGYLQIKNKDKSWSSSNNNERVTIYITVPSVEKLAVSGSGKIKGESTFKSSSLDLAVSGSGSIQLTANVDKVSSRISGSGSIELKGSGKQSSAAVSGSGSVRGFDFKADEAKVTISGSGKCEVNAKNSLKSSISGSGKVVYEGTPSVDSRVSGSGSVQKRS